MTPTQALSAAQAAARVGRLKFSGHARQRMKERGATEQHVNRAVITATRASWQPEYGTWLLYGGTDLDGDDLQVAVELNGVPMIRTVM